MSTSTPWGRSDSQQAYAPGITFYSTPSHGGFKLDTERNAKVPDYMQASTINQQGRQGWYEQDCDWAIVAIVFPDAFSDEQREHARQTLRRWKPDAYQQRFGWEPGERR
jgi:hypothetical protein